MDNKQIGKLVEMSFASSEMSVKSVNKIIEQLNAKELREYLKLLTEREKKLNVYIDHSFDLKAGDKKKFEEQFQQRHIVFRKDPSLIFGLRITDRDMVIDLNMKNALDQIRNYLNRI